MSFGRLPVLMADGPLVQVTAKAATKIRELLPEEDRGRPLRLAVVPSHCMGGRGHAYDLHVARDQSDTDMVVESRGIAFALDRASAELLRGVEVDYEESFQESGFVVKNPNAVGKCPCGHHDLFA